MKIPKEKQEMIADIINSFLNKNPKMKENYLFGHYPNANQTKNLNKRFRWDVAYSAKINFCGLYLEYDCNDDHIDTMLRRIIPDIT
jgi:hypothetical protein